MDNSLESAKELETKFKSRIIEVTLLSCSWKSNSSFNDWKQNSMNPSSKKVSGKATITKMIWNSCKNSYPRRKKQIV